MKPLNELEGRPATDIDLETEKWFQEILDAKQARIPIRSHSTAPHTTNSPELQLQTMYSGIRDLANTQSWNQELRRQYVTIRERLIETTQSHCNTK